MHILSKRARALRAVALLLLCAALVAGCTAPAVHPALDRAGAAVERARSAPRVRALAPAELDRAEIALEHARAAAGAGASPDQVEHLAYVVSQRAALAETRAAERVARSEIDGLQRALDQVLTFGRPDQDRHTRAPLRGNQQKRVLGQGRIEQDRQAAASPAQQDQRDRAPLEADQQEHASLQQDQQEHAPVEEHQPERLSVQDDQRERAPVRQNQDGPLDQAQQERAPAQEDQQDRAPPEQDRQGAAVQRDQQERAIAKEDRQDGASAHEGQPSPGTEPHLVAAIVEPVPHDITLNLSQLPFAGAEPTSDALEQLATLAERLVREPGPSVLIEADFALPDPEARTMMERRVEVVRAVLMGRGIAPARLVVRASGDSPAEPRAAPSFVEPAD